MIEAPTRALREQSADLLHAGLDRLLAEGEEAWVGDERDLLVALAPYHDCARRLGLDPAAVFEAAAAAAPESLRETVRRFGRRDDVTPEAFGFRVAGEHDAPRYEWTPWS